MIEGRGGAPLLHEPPLGVFVSDDLWRQELQGDQTIEAEIARLVGDAYSAASVPLLSFYAAWRS